MSEGVQRLTDVPDWGYLLAEFNNAYRYRSAGGSRLIRGHMKAVRERLSRCIAADPPLDFAAPERKPVCDHLGRALDNGERDTMSGMVRAIDKVKDRLTWRHGYASMPRHLEKRYAYADILGPHGRSIVRI